MGGSDKQSKKRKKKNSEDTTDNEQLLDKSASDSLPISEVIGQAERVLYGDSDIVKTSTPVSTPTADQVFRESNVEKQIKDTNKKLDIVIRKLGKLDTIEQKLLSIDSRLSSVKKLVNTHESKFKETETKLKETDTRLTAVKEKTIELEKSAGFVSNKVHDFEKNIQEMKISMNRKEQSQKELLDEMKRDIKSLQTEKEDIGQLKDSIVDLQCRSMKYNLVFTGLGGETKEEDTEGKLRDFIYFELGVDWKVEFCNVHRFGRFQQHRSRPIVAKFLYENDRVSVLERAYKLKGSGFGINEQFPHAIEERRKQLYPIMRELRSQGNRTKLVKDRLYVNGKLYKGQESKDEHHTGTPDNRQQRHAATHAQHITRSTGAQGRPNETAGRHERQTTHPTTAYSTVASNTYTGHSTGH